MNTTLRLIAAAIVFCTYSAKAQRVEVVTKDAKNVYDRVETIRIQAGNNKVLLEGNRDDNVVIDLSSLSEIIFPDTIGGDIIPGNDILRHFQEALVYRWAMFNGSAGSGTDYMSCNFYARTNVSQLPITFLVPTDDALSQYPDVISFNSKRPRVIGFAYKAGSAFPIAAESYSYDAQTCSVGSRYLNEGVDNTDVTSRLARMVLAHTVAFDRPEDKAKGLDSGNEYFRTLDGSVLRVSADGMNYQGSYQIDSKTSAKVVERYRKNNLDIRLIDAPLCSTDRSLWRTLSEDPRCSEFLALLDSCYISDEEMDMPLPNSTRNRLIKKYSPIMMGAGLDMNLTFFADCDYTLFVPTNAAIQAEKAAGRLSTRDDVMAFLRYHFCYGSEYADRLPFEPRRHNTVFVNEEGGNPHLYISSKGNGSLTVTDGTGKSYDVLSDGKNIFTCDYECVDANSKSKSPVNVTTMNKLSVGTQTPGVVHIIDGVLHSK